MANGFRHSDFIDFNAGQVLRDPMRMYYEIGGPIHGQFSLEQKIDLFEARVEVWHLGVAVEMLKAIEANQPPSIWSHAAYGMLAMIFNYFEMTGKSLNPNANGWRSGDTDFVIGFRDVYDQSNLSDDDIGEFRDRVRNGMYHLGYTKAGLFLHNDDAVAADDFAVRHDAGEPWYYVNPHKAVRSLVDHFASFIRRLKDPINQVMRQKFQEFIDDYHLANTVRQQQQQPRAANP